MPEPGPHPRQRAAPYLEALRSFAARDPRRAMVPGHKGGLAADGGLRAALGDEALALDLPTLIEGVDVRRRRRGRPVRARAPAGGRGVGRAADVVSHQRRFAGQRGGLPGHRAARRARRRAAHRPRQHDRRHRPRGAAPDLRRARGRRRAGRRALRPALRAGRGARRHARRGGGDRRLADVLRRRGRRRAASRASPTPTACRWWSTRRGARTWPSVDALPEHALAAGADLVISSTHKHAGSLTQSAMLHLGAGGRFDEAAIDRALRLVSSTSPSSLLLASLDAARRHAALARRRPAAPGGRRARRAARRDPPHPRPRGPRRARGRVASASRRSTRCECAWTSARPGSAATRSRAGCAATTTSTSSSAASTSWSRCSGSASASRVHGAQLVAAWRARAPARPTATARRSRSRGRAHAPPWGPAALSPRAAFLARARAGADRRRPRAGSRRSAWPPTRPASPTCSPASA